MANLQGSIDQVLGLLPADGSKILFEDFRQKAMTSGIESAQIALAKITKDRLAQLQILPRPGLKADANGKVLPGQDRPHVLLYVSKASG